MRSLQPSKPHLLVVIGIPGSGKSTFISRFAQTFNAPLVDYAELHNMTGNPRSAVMVADYTINQLLLTRQTIAIDGRGSKLSDRQKLASLAHKSGYVPLYIWVQTEPATAENRAVHAKGATRTLDQFDALVLGFQVPTRSEPTVVISGKHTYSSQAGTVLKRLAGERSAEVSKLGTPSSRILPQRGRFIR